MARRKGMKTIPVEGWIDEPDNLKEVQRFIRNTDDFHCLMGGAWGCPDQEMPSYFPEDYGKDIPVDGCWILITKPPPCDIKVKMFSIWFALEATDTKLHHRYPIRRKLASILTPYGELRLEPWEYNKIELEKYLDFLNVRPENSEPDMNIRFLTEDPKLSKKMADMVFYMQSRGISRGTAYLMLIKEIRDQNFCYFEMHDVYVKMFTRSA